MVDLAGRTLDEIGSRYVLFNCPADAQGQAASNSRVLRQAPPLHRGAAQDDEVWL